MTRGNLGHKKTTLSKELSFFWISVLFFWRSDRKGSWLGSILLRRLADEVLEQAAEVRIVVESLGRSDVLDALSTVPEALLDGCDAQLRQVFAEAFPHVLLEER